MMQEAGKWRRVRKRKEGRKVRNSVRRYRYGKKEGLGKGQKVV